MDNLDFTNEEKAMELFPTVPTLECMCKGVREKLVAMANWKDEQFLKDGRAKDDEIERLRNECARLEDMLLGTMYPKDMLTKEDFAAVSKMNRMEGTRFIREHADIKNSELSAPMGLKGAVAYYDMWVGKE